MRDVIDVRPHRSGEEKAALQEALKRAKPDDLVVYHSGPSGSCPRSLVDAAQAMEGLGLAVLTQRQTDQRNGSERIWEYILVRCR